MKENNKNEHILVCLSSSPSNPKVIETASKMAEVFNAAFTALFIETAETKNISIENKKRLENNTELARKHGAKIVTLSGDDIARQVSIYSKTSGVSKIVLGRSGYRANRFFAPPNFVDKIIELCSDTEIFVIPDKAQKIYLGQKHTNRRIAFSDFSFKDTLKSLAILALSTLAGLIFQKFNISESNIIMVFILGVMLTAYITERKIYSLVSSVLAVLIFNFFFTEPYFTTNASSPGYTFTFLIMFFVAFFISSLTKKIKEEAKGSLLKAYRTETMLEMSQKLQQAQNREEITLITINQIKKLLDCDVKILDSSETDTDTDYCYFPIRSIDTVFAVAAVSKKDMSEFEKNLFVAMLREAALAYEKEEIIQSKNKIALRHKQEELRSTLLRAISHDLRTPLTGISGNAELLLKNSHRLSEDKKNQIYTDIYDDSVWLLNLVENLLSITRFDKNEITIKKESELISDVIEEAISHLGRRKNEYTIKTQLDDENLSVSIDARLIAQVIFNLTDNAMKYSEKYSTITIGAYQEDKDIVIFVADEGRGVSGEDKKKIFDIFYTVKNSSVDGRRGLGLGLALCKTVVEAHGGSISLCDNKPCGSIFSVRLAGDSYE